MEPPPTVGSNLQLPAGEEVSYPVIGSWRQTFSSLLRALWDCGCRTKYWEFQWIWAPLTRVCYLLRRTLPAPCNSSANYATSSEDIDTRADFGADFGTDFGGVTCSPSFHTQNHSPFIFALYWPSYSVTPDPNTHFSPTIFSHLTQVILPLSLYQT